MSTGKDAWVVTFLTVAALAAPGLARRAQAGCMDGATSSCQVDGAPGRRECSGGVWGVCEPLPPPGPPILARPSVTARTDRSITLRWSANTLEGEEYQLQQRVGAAWTLLGSLPSSPTTFVDSGLQPETLYCYRVVATGGPHGGRVSNLRCRYTTDGQNHQVARLQVRLRTGNVEDAETDDDVKVELNSAVDGAGGVNLTWVDYGQDDFERGHTFTYDLNLDYLPFRSDVTRLRITKTGTDAWCLAEIMLKVNEIGVYSESFAALPGGCLWLDEDGVHQRSYEIDHARLRAHDMWRLYRDDGARVVTEETATEVTATLTIPRAETESRLEGLIGHLIHGTEAHWGELQGRAYVEADAANHVDRLAVDLDLEGDASNWFDPELDIDFDLAFQARCSDDETQLIADVTTEALEANVDFDWFVNFLGFILPCGPIATIVGNEPIPNCVTALEDYIAEEIKAGFQAVVQSERLPLPPGFRCLSAEVAVDQDPGSTEYGNVELVFQIEKPPAAAEAPAPPPADFGLICAPAGLTVPAAGASSSVCTVTSVNAFARPVDLACPGLPAGITCSFSPATVTPPANGTVTGTLAVSVGLIPAGNYGIQVQASASSTHRHEANVSVTVAGSNVEAVAARFDAVRLAPSCTAVGGSCDSGSSLLLGRGTGGAEPNAPNTIGGGCLDGEAGNGYPRWNAIDRIRVYTADGSRFAPRKPVHVEATVWASSDLSEAADFYYATDATNPSWRLIGTVVPIAAGAQTLSTLYGLPSGSLQAVRVQFRQRTDGTACTAGDTHDRDDLVFAVGATP